jgi:acetylornithine deacetylase/succinyl-diaminopimelate desuccinylase-like protein
MPDITPPLTPLESKLADLVAIPTITGDPVANAHALDYLEQFFSLRGMHIERHVFDGQGAFVASTRTGNAKTAPVTLAGHVDVVSGSREVFQLRVDNDKLLGRGTYDMKFALASYMQLIDELQGNLANYDFTITVTTDEESGGKEGINGTQSLLAAGYRPKVAVLPDSTAAGWNIEKVAKGRWQFDLIANGKAAHGSRPWEGESASSKLIRALHQLDHEFKNHGPTTDTLNIGLIHGGNAFNEVPIEMIAGVEMRIISPESLAKRKAYLESLCTKYGVIVRERATTLPVPQDLSHPFLESFMDSIQVVTGRRPEGIISLAASDAPYYKEYDIPCIISCPKGGKHHSEEEWLDRETFAQFVPILKNYLEKTAKN